MAFSKNNPITQGLSGKFGDQIIFRQRAGMTIAAEAPGPSTKPRSAAQLQGQEKFQEAVVYGKWAKSDPEASKIYDVPDRAAYHVALADFMCAPDIENIDIGDYTGQPGEVIRIRVTDNFKVDTVHLSIHNDDGSLVEEGNATSENGQDWLYTTTAINPILMGDKITVRAMDLPANLTTGEVDM
jgi:hypothetical protein